MDMNWILVSSVPLLLSALFLVKKNQGGAKWKWGNRFERFDKVVESAELTSIAYFRSLEVMLKNLESVRARTERAEQRLQDIIARPDNTREDRYGAAALVLSRGEKRSRVAAMRNLPLRQVKFARAPRNFIGKEQRRATQKPTGENARRNRNGQAEMGSARRQKTAEPAPQTGVITRSAVNFLPREKKAHRLNGAAE